MADQTPVNSQITDTISQTNVTVLGEAPAVALGNLYQASAQTFGMMMQNAAAAQQQLNITAQAVTAQGVTLLYTTTTAAAARFAQPVPPA